MSKNICGETALYCGEMHHQALKQAIERLSDETHTEK
jgi:hypothetical protein